MCLECLPRPKSIPILISLMFPGGEFKKDWHPHLSNIPRVGRIASVGRQYKLGQNEMQTAFNACYRIFESIRLLQIF